MIHKAVLTAQLYNHCGSAWSWQHQKLLHMVAGTPALIALLVHSGGKLYIGCNLQQHGR